MVPFGLGNLFIIKKLFFCWCSFLVKIEIDLNFSKQAELLLNEFKNINRDDIIDWFVNKRKVFIGGGDIVSYLEYVNDKK